MPRIAGHISAPPTPIPTLVAISQGEVWATAPSSEKPANSAAPMKKTRRRPNTSARRPPVTIAIPNVSA
jgi:hypothetical protein